MWKFSPLCLEWGCIWRWAFKEVVTVKRSTDPTGPLPTEAEALRADTTRGRAHQSQAQESGPREPTLLTSCSRTHSLQGWEDGACRGRPVWAQQADAVPSTCLPHRHTKKATSSCLNQHCRYPGNSQRLTAAWQMPCQQSRVCGRRQSYSCWLRPDSLNFPFALLGRRHICSVLPGSRRQGWPAHLWLK